LLEIERPTWLPKKDGALVVYSATVTGDSVRNPLNSSLPTRMFELERTLFWGHARIESKEYEEDNPYG